VPRVEMLQVYNVQVNVSSCTEEEMKAAKWPKAPKERPYDRDQRWVYDDLDAAFDRMRKALPTMPHGAVLMLDVEVMRPDEYAALPGDDD
jgi:hypothetical protein